MSGESKRQSGAPRPTSAGRRRFARYAWLGVVLAAGGGVAWAAEEVVVKAKSATVMGGKSGLSPAVAALNENDKVTVIGREESGWLHVRAPNGKEGYVKEQALTSTALTAGGRPIGSAETSGAAAGNAARGLEPGAEQYVKDRRISPRARADVQHMIDLRKPLEDRPEEFQKWQVDGHVGSGR